MTQGRLGNYKAFFSEKIAKTAAGVSQLTSAETRTNLKNTIAQQYTKCQSSLQELAASNAVQQVKQTVANGYEKTKLSVTEVITSEPVQDLATSIQIVASVGSNKVKEKIADAIGQDNITLLDDNYRTAKSQLTKFMESAEVQRLKAVLDGSTNAVLATNLVFDLGLKMAKETGSWYVGLQCSKYLVACILVAMSAYQPVEIGNEKEDIQETVNLYQSQIDAAYEIAAQLQKVYLNIETLSQGEDQLSNISSKDFEIKRNNVEAEQKLNEIDSNVLIKSLLEGVSESFWAHFMLRLLALAFPVAGSLNVLFVATTLAYATILALNKNQQQNSDEIKINLLKKQFEPIYASLQNLKNKLDLDSKSLPDAKAIVEEVANESSPMDINGIIDNVSKVLGLHSFFQIILQQHGSLNNLICLLVLQFTAYDLYKNNQDQQALNNSFKDFESKMKNLVAMTDDMEKLLSKQENYEKYLLESNKSREVFRKLAEECRLEALKKAEELRRQRVAQHEFAILRQEENMHRMPELMNVAQSVQQPEEKMHVQQDMIISPEVKEAKDAVPSPKPTHYFYAGIAGVVGAGVGCALGICIATLLAVPTLGLSIVIPALCASISGIISFATVFWLTNRDHAESGAAKNSIFYKHPGAMEQCKHTLNSAIFRARDRFGVVH